MSLNIENIGTPVVICEASKKQDRRIICIDDGKGAVVHPFKELKLPHGNIFQQIPKPDGREILYITGQSGSGKSVYTANYAKQYKKMFKDNDIFLFSALDGDSSIDKVKGIKRIKLEGNEFLSTELDAKDFANSLCIFDDCDVIKNKPIEKKVHSLMDNMLQIGRHHNTSIIYTTHTATNNKETKVILAEAHSITIFPKSMGNASLKYLCDAYLGLDKKEIAGLKKMDGRWVTITRTFPKVVFSEDEIYIPSSREVL
jgi:hypothetical protein